MESTLGSHDNSSAAVPRRSNVDEHDSTAHQRSVGCDSTLNRPGRSMSLPLRLPAAAQAARQQPAPDAPGRHVEVLNQSGSDDEPELLS